MGEGALNASMVLQEADAAAAAIMTTTEGAVRTEMEAAGIYEQVRLAVEAAQRGKMDQLASSQSTVVIDWESERDEKPQMSAPDDKDLADQHRVCPSFHTACCLLCRYLAACCVTCTVWFRTFVKVHLCVAVDCFRGTV